jgi:hypothetical protein
MVSGKQLVVGGAAVAAVAIIGSKIFGASITSPSGSQTPASITLVSSSVNVAVGQTVSLSASLYDQNGNTIANYPITLNGDGTLSATTDSTGTATWNITFSVAGTYNISAVAV